MPPGASDVFQPRKRVTPVPSALGLIAGNGQFPFCVADEARSSGRRVVVVAIPGETDPRLADRVDAFHWVDLGQIKKTIQLFCEAGVGEAVMAGQVKHTQLFRRLKLDLTAVKLLATLPNRKTDTVLGAIAKEFERHGIHFLSSVSFLKGQLAPEGYLSSHRPTREQKEDVFFGFEAAKVLGGLDAGQTVCVRDKTVLALEAMEGTDACILRAGALSQGPFCVIKTAKPRQDVRFDVPVIGRRTLAALRESGAAVLAVEAGATLVLDRVELVKGAEEAGLVIWGVKRS